MLSSAKRRISLLERSIELPMTFERFKSLIEERMRLTGISVEEACESLISTLGVENLDRLEKELIQVFGDDVEASDDAARNAATEQASQNSFR